MKYGTIAVIIIFTIMNINYAIAGGRHGRHDQGISHNNHYDKHGRYNHDDSYDPHFSRQNDHYDKYSRHKKNDVAYLIGGLIVGSIIGAVVSSQNNNRTSHLSYNRPNYVTSHQQKTSIRPSYLKQADGNCYVINNVINGNMVLSAVSINNCQ